MVSLKLIFFFVIEIYFLSVFYFICDAFMLGTLVLQYHLCGCHARMFHHHRLLQDTAPHPYQLPPSITLLGVVHRQCSGITPVSALRNHSCQAQGCQSRTHVGHMRGKCLPFMLWIQPL